MDKNSEGLKDTKECVQEVAKVESLRILLEQDNTVGAITCFSHLVETLSKDNLDPCVAEEGAKLLAEHIQKCSIYRRMHIMENCFESMPMIGRFILARFLNTRQCDNFNVPVTGISMDSLMVHKLKCPVHQTSPKYVSVMKKGPLPYPMAFGLNIKGKLGIGDNIKDAETSFQRVLLDGDVKKVYLGESHSIFLMENGDFYGAGVPDSFLDNVDTFVLDSMSQGLPYPSICTTPQYLCYMNENKLERSAIHWMNDVVGEPCAIESNKTLFFHFQKGHTLIISPGISEMRFGYAFSGQRELKSIRIEKEESDESPEPYEKVIIDTNKHHFRFVDNEMMKSIIYFFSGNRVEPNVLFKIEYGDKGTLWACYGGNLYNGKLEIVLNECRRNERKEKVLVAMMEEVILPYAVENFSISPDGTSIVVYNIPTDEVPTCWNIAVKHKASINFVNTVPQYSLQSQILAFAGMFHHRKYNNLYDYMGLPTISSESYLIWLQTLARFIHIREGEKLPELFKRAYKEIKSMDDEPRQIFEGYLKEILKNSSAIRPITLKMCFHKVAEREKQAVIEFNKLYEPLLAKVQRLHDTLDTLPLLYRRTTIIESFLDIMTQLLSNCVSGPETVQSPNQIRMTKIVYRTSAGSEVIGCLTAFKQRVANKDIDASDARFETIRVEAIVDTHKGTEITRTAHDCLLTVSHIKSIREDLIQHIDDGVLNLNMYCYNRIKTGASYKNIEELFVGLVEICFFQLKERTVELTFLENGMFLCKKESLQRGIFAKKELYTVKCQDGQFEAPKIFFELYSDGFEVARRGNARREGKNPYVVEWTNITKHIAKLIVYSLIDIGKVQNETVENLYEALEVTEPYLFKDLSSKLVTIIIKKARPSDFHLIPNLFHIFPVVTIETIAKFRLDMLVYWKEFPMTGNYLNTLKMIIEKIEEQEVEAPISSMVEKCSNQGIDSEWLRGRFLNGDTSQFAVDGFNKTFGPRQDGLPVETEILNMRTRAGKRSHPE